MKIIDNALPKPLFKNLQDKIMSTDFPWFLLEGVTFKGDGHFQFCHLIFGDGLPSSALYEEMGPILKKLNAAALIRIKVNLTTNTPEIVAHPMHVDLDINCKTAIFYINSNNGYTEFENGEKIESVENRLVIFNSNNFHRGTTCTDEKARIVMNFNFFELDYFRNKPK